jgi:hypothetical protein
MGIQDAKRVRLKMLSALLRNYGIAMSLGSVFLPVLTGIEVEAWKEAGAIAIGVLLSGLAIYVAPRGEEADRQF